ncbi:MAG: hypothetical protein QW156_04475 [Candidatus Aenigmatarchaeota archaeon]
MKKYILDLTVGIISTAIVLIFIAKTSTPIYESFYQKLSEYCGGEDQIKTTFSEFDLHGICKDGRKFPPCGDDTSKFEHIGYFGLKWCDE